MSSLRLIFNLVLSLPSSNASTFEPYTLFLVEVEGLTRDIDREQSQAHMVKIT